MEYKKIRIIVIALVVIGVVIGLLINSMTDYALDDLTYSTPMKSERWLVIWSYLSIVETIILFIVIPILYLLNIKRKKGFVQEEKKTGFCKSCGAEILDKTGDFCSKCGAPLT